MLGSLKILSTTETKQMSDVYIETLIVLEDVNGLRYVTRVMVDILNTPPVPLSEVNIKKLLDKEYEVVYD